MAKNKIVALVLTCIMLLVTLVLPATAGNANTGVDYSDYKYWSMTIPYEYQSANTFQNVKTLLPSSVAHFGNGKTWDTDIDYNNTAYYTVVQNENTTSNTFYRVQTTLNFLDTNRWGYAFGSNSAQKTLKLEFRATDFFIPKTYWSAFTPTQAFPYINMNIEDWAQPELIIKGFIDVLIRKPVNSTGGEVFDVVHVPFLKQTRPQNQINTSLFITETEYATALGQYFENPSNNLGAELLAQALEQDYVYFSNVTCTVDVPINTDTEAYECFITMPYARKQGTESTVNENASMFARYLNEVVTPHIIGGDEVKLNVMGTIVDNLNAVLKLEILGNVTLGFVVWLCVAIGALFGILKYFAGG